ncbi:MAG: hypothetical protein ACE5KE_03715, partial [Methanosarcinales archaeon]
LTAKVANQSKELLVNFSCTHGNMYNITCGFCINKLHVEDTFNLLSGFGPEDVEYAYLRVNGNLVGSLIKTFV